MARPRTTDLQDIVKAAAVVFERRGYADATLDGIAAQAGVSKPTIYQYVESKQRLLEIVVEQAIYPLRDGIEEIVSGPGTAAEKLAAYVALHVRAAIRFRVYYLVLMADQHQLSERGLRKYQAWARQVNHAASHLIEQGIEEGSIDASVDVAIAANLLNSMLTSIARWYRPGSRLSAEQVQEQVLLFLGGLLPAPARVES
jgi:TetR/AcrR family transcriptional regulator, cholesterol catabolism regulator